MVVDLRKPPVLTLPPAEPPVVPVVPATPTLDLRAPYAPPAPVAPPSDPHTYGDDSAVPVSDENTSPVAPEPSLPRTFRNTFDLANQQRLETPPEVPAYRRLLDAATQSAENVTARAGEAIDRTLAPVGDTLDPSHGIRDTAALAQGRYEAGTEPITKTVAGAVSMLGHAAFNPSRRGEIVQDFINAAKRAASGDITAGVAMARQAYDKYSIPVGTGLVEMVSDPENIALGVGPGAAVTDPALLFKGARAIDAAIARGAKIAGPKVAQAGRELLANEAGEVRFGEFFPGGEGAVPEPSVSAAEAVTPSVGEDRGPKAGEGREPVSTGREGTVPPVEPPIPPDVLAEVAAQRPHMVEHQFSHGLRTEPNNPVTVQAALQENGTNLHEVRPTAPALEGARQRVIADPGATYDRVLAKDPAQFTDADVFDAQALVQHYGDLADNLAAAGDEAGAARATQQAVEVAYKADQAGLALGRGVQAFSGWQRLSPERQLAYANKVLRVGEEAVGPGRLKGSLENAVDQSLQAKGDQQLAESKARARDYSNEAARKSQQAKLTPDQELAKRLRQEAQDLRYLSDEESRIHQPRIIEDTRKAILEARKQVRENKIELPTPVAMDLLERARVARDLPVGSPERYRAVQDTMALVRNLVPPTRLQQTVQALGLPRVAITMWDFSAPFRQGRYILADSPVIWTKAWAPMVKAFKSADFAGEIDAAIHTAPVMQRPGADALYLAPRGPAAALGKNEEQWLTRAAGSAEGWKRLIGPGASEDAYITFLNKIRVDKLTADVKALEDAGIQVGEREIREMAQGINLLTGRGYLGPAERASGVLSHVLFAPKYLAASVERPLNMARAMASLAPGAQAVAPNLAMSRAAAQKIARAYGAYYAVGLSTLGLMGIAGAKVGRNPLASDFGDVQWGPFRFNLWGEDAQLMTAAARVLTGKTMTSFGNTNDANRLDVLGRFLRSKLEPIFGYGVSALKGTGYLGYPMNGPLPPNSNLGNIEQATGIPITKTLGNAGGYVAEATNSVPSVVSNFLNGYTLQGQNGGALGGATAALPASVGMNVQAYQNVQDFRNEESQRRFGKPFEKLNQAQQREVDASDFVQQGAAQQPNTPIDGTALRQAAGQLYADRNQTIEYGTTLPNGSHQPGLADIIHMNGGVLNATTAKAIKDANDARYQNAQTTFANPAVISAGHAQGDQLLEDALAARYWSAEAPIGPDGQPDYRAQDAARQAVLDDAAKFGVDPTYITRPDGKGFLAQRYKDPTVQRVYEQYVKAIDTLKPYYAIADTEAAKFGLTPAKIAANKTVNPQTYAIFTARVDQARENMRATNSAVEQAGELLGRWQPLKLPSGPPARPAPPAKPARPSR